METRVPGYPSVLGILLLFAYFSSRTEAAFDPESFQQKLVALQKVLDYMNNRPEQMNLDATIGVTITEANLVAALLHENVQYLEDKFFIALKEIVALSDMTRRHLMAFIPKNETKFLMLSALNNPKLWIKPISWTRIFSRSRPHPHQSNYWEIVRLMQWIMHGTPTETESDQCLIEIVRSNLEGKCEIPATCVATLMRDDDTTGYPLTHRLLIVQVAKALGCEKANTISLSSLIPVYCARIFKEFINIEAWNFPNVARDLMLEQVVLCGMEGYYEFVDKHYEDTILSWPHWSGCFALFEFSNEHHITRRSSSRTDFGCDNHMTSLGAASLAVFIRENIENALSQS